MTTPAATRVPEILWQRLTEYATGVVTTPTAAEQLKAAQGMLEQATIIRHQLVVGAHEKGLSLARIGRALDMSPEGARQLHLRALKEQER